MHQRSVVLINENRMRPPVAPLALDYLGGRLRAAGVPVRLVDHSFAVDPMAETREALADDPVAVGISFRNTDDCYLASGAWFVPRLTELVAQVRDANIKAGQAGLEGAEQLARILGGDSQSHPAGKE